MYAFICYKCCIPCRLYVPSTLDQNPIDSKGLTICICQSWMLQLKVSYKALWICTGNLMKCKCCTCCRMQVKWPSISQYLRALLVFPWDSLTFWAFRNQKQQAPNSSWRCDGCYLLAASLQPAAMPQKWWHLLDDCGASATGRCAVRESVFQQFVKNHVTWQILRFDHVSLRGHPVAAGPHVSRHSLCGSSCWSTALASAGATEALARGSYLVSSRSMVFF